LRVVEILLQSQFNMSLKLLVFRINLFG